MGNSAISNRAMNAVGSNAINYLNPGLGVLNNAAQSAVTGLPRDYFQSSNGRCATLDLAKTVANEFEAYKADQRNEMRAGLLWKFMNLIEFPKEDGLKEFKVAIVGDPAVRKKFLQNSDGKIVRGKPVRLVEVSDPSQLKDVSLAYVGRDCKNKKEWFNQKKPGLLMVEAEGTPRHPLGDAQLYNSNGKIRFRINVDQVRRDQLKISPRLVKVTSTLITDDQ